MAGILLKLRTWWETADRTQRAVTLFGGGFLLLLLIGTFYFASRPKMEMVFGGLTPAEQGTVVEEVQKLGIPVEFDLAGNVLVPSGKVSEVKMRLASAGKLPSASHWGYGDLEKIGMMTTPRVERERLKSVMEGELAKTIEFLDSVETARVHLTLGDDSPFAGDEKPATASVTISEKAMGGINNEQAKSISQLVAKSVPGLLPKNITIVDQNLKPIWLGEDENSAGGRASERLAAEVSEGRRREQQIQQKLDYFFGPGAAVVTVDLRLDYSNAEEDRVEPIVAERPVSQSSVEETMTGAGGTSATGGPAGLGANTLEDPPGAGVTSETGGGEGYRSKQRDSNFAYGEVRTKTQKSPGEVKSMSISVLVDTNKVSDPTQVQKFVNQYLGPRATDPNFTAQVTEVKRDASLEQAAAATAQASVGASRLQQLLALLPIVALVIVAFIVFRGLGKAASEKSLVVTALPGGRVMPMALGTRPAQAVVGGLEPALDGPSTARALQPELDDLPEIAAKVNKPLEQIKRMSHDRPETVAMLIKSWLLEESK